MHRSTSFLLRSRSKGAQQLLLRPSFPRTLEREEKEGPEKRQRGESWSSLSSLEFTTAENAVIENNIDLSDDNLEK